MSAAGITGGVATGIGSWPGTDPREAAAIIVGELGDLPHLVELPERGVGADMLGRSGALLVDLHFDTTARGYRLTRSRGPVAKRAFDYLREDLDALEEAWETAGLANTGKTIKLQSSGPLTLAAEIELVNGHRVLTDSGATRDFADSLAEGLARHVAEVRRRFGADVLLQLDEPTLPAVLAGTLRGVTSMDQVRAVPGPDALSILNKVIDAAGAPVLVHSCAPSPPLELLRRSNAAFVGVDVSLLEVKDLDGIGELLEAGKSLALGLVAAVDPTPQPNWRAAADPALKLVDRLGFSREVLGNRVVVTPTCGLSGATLDWARAALRVCTETARAFAEEPAAL